MPDYVLKRFHEVNIKLHIYKAELQKAENLKNVWLALGIIGLLLCFFGFPIFETIFVSILGGSMFAISLFLILKVDKNIKEITIKLNHCYLEKERLEDSASVFAISKATPKWRTGSR